MDNERKEIGYIKNQVNDFVKNNQLFNKFIEIIKEIESDKKLTDSLNITNCKINDNKLSLLFFGNEICFSFRLKIKENKPKILCHYLPDNKIENKIEICTFYFIGETIMCSENNYHTVLFDKAPHTELLYMTIHYFIQHLQIQNKGEKDV
ncbi:MAG: hypothetical protein L6300_06955 [Syntrophaceae bacterium]|nr:hypothetical protein [Actinomycetota bacterium]MCG2739964.1 hypothetical protein [Syntrophaceae bacterium]